MEGSIQEEVSTPEVFLPRVSTQEEEEEPLPKASTPVEEEEVPPLAFLPPALALAQSP